VGFKIKLRYPAVDEDGVNLKPAFAFIPDHTLKAVYYANKVALKIV